MPWSAVHPCSEPGCRVLVRTARCPKHARQQEAERDGRRQTAPERGYDWRWRHARRLFLKEHPLCIVCLSEGKTSSATVVDHVVPHRGDQARFWAVDNWQGLCRRHHDAKTRAGL
jgi:5-methylcytosine-specific restriction enzyme A